MDTIHFQEQWVTFHYIIFALKIFEIKFDLRMNGIESDLNFSVSE